MDNKLANELLEEMRSVKKLLILQLLRNEVPQKQIASMLEISEATMSRMIPRGTVQRKIKRAPGLQSSGGVGAEHE